MRKKLISIALMSVMVLSLFAGCNGGSNTGSTASGTQSTGSTESSSSEEAYTVNMVILGTQEPADLGKIEDKINEILVRDINMKIDVSIMNWGSYQQQLPLLLSGGEKVDLVPVLNSYAGTFVSQQQVLDLSPLIDQYGTNIKQSLGETVAKGSKMENFIYGVTTNREWFTESGIVMRKDWLEESGITVGERITIEEIEAIFEAVKSKHPDASMYFPAVTMGDGRFENTDALSDFNGVLMNYGQTTTVENFYATEYYKEYAERTYNWAQNGWISKDAATTTDPAESAIKAGSAFSYPVPIKPGLEVQVSLQNGMPMVCLPIYEPMITTSGVSFLTWGIAQNSENPEKTMQLLDYLYGSAEITDFLNWGIESEHYKTNEDGTIGFLDGMDATTSPYHLNQGWLLPNQFISKIWEGTPLTVWDDTKAINESAQKSMAFGFTFDSTPVANEIAAITSVTAKYRTAINAGSVDPSETLPGFLAELETAGIEKVIAEKQRQLDAWLETQK